MPLLLKGRFNNSLREANLPHAFHAKIKETFSPIHRHDLQNRQESFRNCPQAGILCKQMKTEN